MITMRRQLLGLGFVAASSLLAINAAQALTGPTSIQIDGGPLGPLQLSGGVDGFGYYVSGAGSVKSNGADIGAALVQLQKSTGQVQFTIEVGSTGGVPSLGAGAPGQTSIKTYTTGPLYYGYVTYAPTGMPFTISAGQLGSLEGYESGVDWNNSVQITTALFAVENANSRGVSANLTEGPVSATVTYGDGVDSGAFNTVQALVTYTINATNVANVYGTVNFGHTGPYTFLYGGGTTGAPDVYASTNMLGAYYSYTMGNLNVVPEVQYQYAKADVKFGLNKAATNLGAALFGNYAFGTSPYSIGAWAEYFTEHSGAADNLSQFGPGADAQMVGFAVAPTWQYKDLFARANAGYIYLLHDKNAVGSTYGFGGSTNRGQFLGTMEAGLLF